MGRASKWIRNLLVGKKEEKSLKEGSSSNRSSSKYFGENLMLAILPDQSPKVKARWSFSRSSTSSSSAAAEPRNNLKISRSFDSSVPTNQQLTTMAASLKYQTFRQISSTTEPVPTQQVAVLPKTTIPAELSVANVAATRIQSFFRSYLARRALLALRGLVKLQALVRGHLVRKRTTATMRCIHALISIQVRARVQRIQMAKEEEASLVPKRQSTTRREQHQMVNIHKRAPYDEQRMLADDMKRTGNSSRNLSFLRHDQCLPASPNSSRNPESHTSPHYTFPDTEIYQMEAHHLVPVLEYTNQMSHNCTWLPNYMADTESSIAKLRSHSEPKQRPKGSDKKITRRSTSNEEIAIDQEDFRVLRQFSDVRPNTQKNQWLHKLRRPTRKVITKTGRSNNYEDLIHYDQPPVNLY